MTDPVSAAVADAKAAAAKIIAAPLPTPAAATSLLTKLKSALGPLWAKVKSMLASILTPLLTPAIRIVGYAIAALLVASGIYVAGAVHEHKIMAAKQAAAIAAYKKEADNAISAANAARDAAQKKFDDSRANPPRGVISRVRKPARDPFRRD